MGTSHSSENQPNTSMPPYQPTQDGPPPPTQTGQQSHSRTCSLDLTTVKAKVGKIDKMTLYLTDTCPFAQRTWLALLEKEDDPYNPQLFDTKFVNCYDKSIATNAEFLSVNPQGMVPSVLHQGNKMYGSLLVNEYIEEAIRPSKSLMLPTLEGKWRVRMFIEKNTPLAENIMPLLLSTNKGGEERNAANEKMLGLVRTFESWIVGPYAMGDQFTLADIAFIPVFERLLTVCGHYTGFAIPNEPAYFKTIAWWALVNSRPSVKITRAERTTTSLSIYPGEAKARDAYLIELAEPYTYGLGSLARTAYATALPGKRVFTSELLQKHKADEESKKQVLTPQSAF
jgi:glutathione S-transferase